MELLTVDGKLVEDTKRTIRERFAHVADDNGNRFHLRVTEYIDEGREDDVFVQITLEDCNDDECTNEAIRVVIGEGSIIRSDITNEDDWDDLILGFVHMCVDKLSDKAYEILINPNNVIATVDITAYEERAQEIDDFVCDVCGMLKIEPPEIGFVTGPDMAKMTGGDKISDYEITNNFFLIREQDKYEVKDFYDMATTLRKGWQRFTGYEGLDKVKCLVDAEAFGTFAIMRVFDKLITAHFQGDEQVQADYVKRLGDIKAEFGY